MTRVLLEVVVVGRDGTRDRCVLDCSGQGSTGTGGGGRRLHIQQQVTTDANFRLFGCTVSLLLFLLSHHILVFSLLALPLISGHVCVHAIVIWFTLIFVFYFCVFFLITLFSQHQFLNSSQLFHFLPCTHKFFVQNR